MGIYNFSILKKPQNNHIVYLYSMYMSRLSKVEKKEKRRTTISTRTF